MSTFADLARQVGRNNQTSAQSEVMNIIEFVESPQGLKFSKELTGQGLFPVQKFILKCYYNLELDDTVKSIDIPKSWRFAQSKNPNERYQFTEKEYLQHLYNEGRCNLKELDHDRRELILPIGRRSGKSAISAMIASYETYKLLRKGNPQAYYGVPEGNRIQICAIATAKDQAGLLYSEVARHFSNCDYFDQFLSRKTQSSAQFQTARDIDISGSWKEGGTESLRITFYSSVAKGLRGPANIVVILDEVAFFTATGQTSAEDVYKAVSPSVATFSPKDPKDASVPLGDSEGRIILISSPHAREGLFYEKYATALSGNAGASDLLMIQAPTWEVNPTVPHSYLEKEYHKDPVSFSCEFGAEFTDQVKAWIERPEDLFACINPDARPLLKGMPRESHYLGLDIAVKGDRTAVVLTKPDDGFIKLVYHEQWQAGVPWRELNPHLKAPLLPYAMHLEDEDVLDFEEIAKWMLELSKKFYIAQGMFDSFEGISFEQTVRKIGLPQIEMVNFTRNQTSEMFQAFKNLMYHQKLELYDFPHQGHDPAIQGHVSPHIQELLELQSHSHSKRLVLIEAPSTRGKHDDFSDALVRSVWMSQEKISKMSRNVTGRANYNQQAQGPTNVPRSANEYQRRKARFRNYSGKR